MPYRTLDDRIDGVVITFANITVAKTLEAKLRGQHASLENGVAEPSAQRAKATPPAPKAVVHKSTQAAGKTRRPRKS